MAAGHWRSKLGSHIFSLKHKTQSELEVRRGYKLSTPARRDYFLQKGSAQPPEGSTSSLNGTPNCWPSAQIHEPMRDISYANHHSLYIYFWGFVFDLLLLLIEFSRLYVFSVSLLFEVQGLVFFSVLPFPLNCFISDPCFPFGLLDI